MFAAARFLNHNKQTIAQKSRQSSLDLYAERTVGIVISLW
jgi:hypothetical protein